jgi:ubiquinone/menaquinone biosynthesis C-methylase UbiE
LSDFSNFLDVQTKTAWVRTLAEFASFCDPEPASTILDIGCGPGLLPIIFACENHIAFGVDYDFALLASGSVPLLAQANAFNLPFPDSSFNLVTATNVLFLFDNPILALQEWACLLASEGELCLLNPSENLSENAATQIADARGLDGTARKSLLHWAQLAESHFHWTEAETLDLLSRAGLRLEESALRVGPGFARFVRARVY